MKQTNTELTINTAELIAAIEADIAEAHYRRLAAGWRWSADAVQVVGNVQRTEPIVEVETHD